MKKYMIFPLFLFAFSFLKGQDFIRMINDSIYWDIHYAEMGYICGGYGGGGDRFFFGNDTVINDTLFTNVRAFNIISDYWPEVDCPPFHVDTVSYKTRYSLFESDDGIIYIFDEHEFSPKIKVLFDYNVNIGDSIYFEPEWFYIDEINIITTNDNVERRKYIDHLELYEDSYFIEGLGSNVGPVYPPFYFFEDGPWPDCWGYFNNNINTCDEFYDINELHPNTVSISPNPFYSEIKITSDEPIISLRIFDLSGKTILARYLKRESYHTIDLSSLYNGIYFMQIYGPEFSEVKMIVKQ